MRLQITINNKIRVFLEAEAARTGRSLADVMRFYVCDRPEYRAFHGQSLLVSTNAPPQHHYMAEKPVDSVAVTIAPIEPVIDTGAVVVHPGYPPIEERNVVFSPSDEMDLELFVAIEDARRTGAAEEHIAALEADYKRYQLIEKARAEGASDEVVGQLIDDRAAQMPRNEEEPS